MYFVKSELVSQYVNLDTPDYKHEPLSLPSTELARLILEEDCLPVTMANELLRIMNPPKVSIIIVSWNTEKYLKSCLESVIRNVISIGYELFVVDNNSADASADMVASDFPSVKLIRNNANIGFARANNMAISASSGEYVLVLNPDTVVLPGAVEKMAEFMNGHPRVGVCGPKILDGSGRVDPWRREFPTLKRAFWRDSILGRLFPVSSTAVQQTDYSPDMPKQVDWIHGCCMFVRRKTIQEVGVMEQKLFLTFEEQDWCLRMYKNNWEAFYVPAAGIIHYGAESRKQISNLEDYLHTRRSEFVFIRKHYGMLSVLCLRCFVAFSSLMLMVKWLILCLAMHYSSLAVSKRNFYTSLFWVSIGYK